MPYADAILDAIACSGKSEREISISAVGHESAIRSLKRGLDLRGSTIEALCYTLGLEFYIGPPRDLGGTPPDESAPLSAAPGGLARFDSTAAPPPIPNPQACDTAAPREIAHTLNLPDGATIPEAVAEIERLVKLPSEMTSLLAKAR